jgi:hypothetical protein
MSLPLFASEGDGGRVGVFWGHHTDNQPTKEIARYAPATLISIKVLETVCLDNPMMDWQPISTAQFDRDLAERGFYYSSRVPCRVLG